MALSLRRNTEASSIVSAWWEDLQSDTGTKAGLRRCRELSEVYYQPGFHRLRRKLELTPETKNFDGHGLAAVAALLSHVRFGSIPHPIARQMAGLVPGESAPLSELRFRRLLQCQSHAELFPYLVRAVKMLENSVSLPSLIEGAYHWGERIRQEWAMDYYAAYIGNEKN